MTKREQKTFNKFLMSVLKHKNRRFVPATVFDKRNKPGKQLVVIPVKDIINQYNKFKEQLGE